MSKDPLQGSELLFLTPVQVPNAGHPTNGPEGIPLESSVRLKVRHPNAKRTKDGKAVPGRTGHEELYHNFSTVL